MQTPKFRLIAIDDEPNILISIESCLGSAQYKIDCFTNTADAYIAMQRHVYDCVLLDIRLGAESGIDFFKKMLAAQITVPVIFMSGNASLNEAAESQKLGAYDFLEKPFSAEKLKITIDNCINYYQLKNKVKRLESEGSQYDLIGEHPLMQQLKLEIEKVAKTNAAVIIQGESGTGKELIASAIHNASLRKNNEFITVNCSAIPQNLVESALFGHKKGAFTGADESKKGYFEQAHNGTIFLDEIGDMPLSAQASLLRVLEAKEIQKVGADNVTMVDVRILAATHKNLKEEVANGNFRQDLFYRISVIPLISPALRERLSDLPLLVIHLISRLSKRHGVNPKNIEESCLQALKNYSWPGNVRELTNTLERMIIMGGESLTIGDIPKDVITTDTVQSNEISLKAHRSAAERGLIISRLNYFNGNISQVARSLDIDRTNLHKKINQYQINREYDFN